MTDDVPEASVENYSFQKVIAVLAVTLLIIKFTAWFLTSSMAVFTDAMESIVNVVAAFMGLYALYLSAQPADKSHPYGHGKVELISSFVEGVMIVTAGVLIVFEAIDSLLNPDEIERLDFGLLLLVLTALANFVVGRMAIRKGKKNRSVALIASGKHLCSDTYSSVGIIIGLFIVYIALWMGYDAAWLDSSIAIIFGVIIGYTGLKVIRQSIDDSMDRTDEAMIKEVVEILNVFRHDDWIDIYGLRVIKYGHHIFVDMHIILPKDQSVEHTFEEEVQLQEALKWKFGEAVEVSVTPVPCNDHFCRYCERNCFNRKVDFVKHLKWNEESLMTREMHIPPSVIVIDDSIKFKG